jgi:hypothetical protein
LGYYRKGIITAHFKSCAEDDPTRYVKEFNFALLSPNIDETLRPVTSLMKDDKITHVAMNDSLKTEYGKKLYSKTMTKGTVTKTENYVSTKMRELSRLLIEVRFMKDSKMTLDELICVEQFQSVVESTTSLCQIKDNDIQKTIPSLALKIGYSLKKSANDALVRAIEHRDARRETEVEKFLKLMALEWEERVAEAARMKLKQKHTLRIDLMPLAQDLKVGVKRAIYSESKHALHMQTYSLQLQCPSSMSSFIPIEG